MSADLDDAITWLDDASRADMGRVIEALHRVHRLIAVIMDLDSLLTRIVEESRYVADAEASSLMLYDANSEELYFHVALGDSGDQEALKREIRLKPGQGIAGATASARKPINVENAQEDPRFYRGADAASRFQTRSLLAVPMLDRDNLVGVLEVVNKIGGESFSTLDMRVMEMFSSLAATSIVNARLIEEHIRTERLAAIGQAVTGLSHYTKNIVTGLSSSAELIEMGLESGNIDVLKRSFPVFKRSTKRITHFVEDMLSFSKPRKPIRETCRVGALIEEACETFAELFERKHIEVCIDTDAAAGEVYADPQAIYRCLLNLLTNAADVVPRVGGRIDVVARTTGNGATEITVGDNGPGVPEEQRERIFDPFFSTKGSEGTGLGLAVTQKIIREHGGDVTVANRTGGGAVFRVTLPLDESKSQEMLDS